MLPTRFTRIILLAVLAIALGRMFIKPRLNVPTAEGGYEAAAHLLCGLLILVRFYDPKQILGPSKLFWWAGWSLALWELAWILVQAGVVHI